MSKKKFCHAFFSLFLCAAMAMTIFAYSGAETTAAQEPGVQPAATPTPTVSPIADTEEHIEQLHCDYGPDGHHEFGSESGIFPHPKGMFRGSLNQRYYEASCTHAPGSSSERPCKYCYTWFTVIVNAADGAATGHTYGPETEVTDACDGATYKMKECTVCGYVDVQVTKGTPDASAHTLQTVTVTEGDCKTDVNEKTVCTVCNAVLSCNDRGPVGHSGNTSTVQNGNCRQPFIREFKCAVCDYKNRVEYPGNHIFAAVDNPKATCETAGTRVRKCIVCGLDDPVRPTETIPALGHDWKDVDASACTDGQEQQCTRCGKTQVVGGTGEPNHKWGEDLIMHATCTEAGYTYHVCQKCGVIARIQENVEPMLDHSFTEEKMTVPPTCGQDGTAEKVCSVCGTGSGQYVPIKATGDHTPMPDDGDCTTAVRCSVCDEILTEAKPAHEWTYTRIPAPQYAVKMHKKVCKNCGTTEEELCFGENDGDCFTPVICQYCGSTVKEGSIHVAGPENQRVYVPLEEDKDNYHIALCSHADCEQTVASTKEAHTYVDGVCTKCNHVHGKDHIPDGKYESDGTYHWQRCTLCGAKTEIQVHDKSETSPYEGDCTHAVKCTVCDRVVRDAAVHTYPDEWDTTGQYHYHVCVNPGCNAEERFGHEGVSDHDCTTPTKCKDCGMILVAAAQEHAWKAAESGHTDEAHRLICSNDDCAQTKTEAHTAGIAATCCEKAECNVCHTKFGALDPKNHVGNEEIRNAKQATETEEGYTGDVYCLGCDQLKQKGEVIEKTPAHVHQYTEYNYDGTTHTPKCSICGQTDETQRSSHVYGDYTIDEGSHSRTCTVCGNVDSEPHEHGTIVHDCTVSITCADCGKVLVPGKASHSFNGRVTAMAEGHATACTNENCEVLSDLVPHAGGTSTCQSGAHCDVCDYEYREKDSGVHTGGVELRDAKAATTEEKGYTGDSYCLGCGALLEKGTEIDPIAQDPSSPGTADEHTVLWWALAGLSTASLCGMVIVQKRRKTHAS